MSQVATFRQRWLALEDGAYHFTRGKPETQLQMAFKNHWRVFSTILAGKAVGRVAEVGCGRGSMGAFFADAGAEVHLVDTSEDALQMASRNFARDQLPGHFVKADVCSLPYEDEWFDVVFSIGLWEHFRDPQPMLAEQLRVLRQGGTLIGYVVPGGTPTVQKVARPMNYLLGATHRCWLRLAARGQRTLGSPRTALYRSPYGSAAYGRILGQIGCSTIQSSGIFPVPLISHSPDFPFTPLPQPLERLVMHAQRCALVAREPFGEPWLCRESWGAAFVLWATK